MKKILLTILSVLLLFSGSALADEFSLYGVKLGMPRAEVDNLWQKLESGKYAVEDSILINIQPEFDHRNRLYQLGFSLPIPLLDEHPGAFVNTAFQELIQERWADEDHIVNLRTGRGSADVVVTSKSMQNEYQQHVRTQMQLQLGILLKP